MQTKLPLFEALMKHKKQQPISFHVPGHKNGLVFPKQMSRHYQDLLRIDVTELTHLDDLHAPTGVIAEAQTLLAAAYQADKSYFLVNGTTVGNLAMILSVCEENDIVLVQRNCHKSILNGLKLAKVIPVFLQPTFDQEWKVAGGVSLETVQTAINMYPQAKAIILTSPNYYGLTTDLKAIITEAHRQQMPVLVDEAHGAHFIIGEPFPPSAVQLGADIVVQSAHKTLPAMTMGSYLHVNEGRICLQQLEDRLQMLQSSSPSYPIMGSLDIARSYVATFTKQDLESNMMKVDEFTAQLRKNKQINVLRFSQDHGDPLKITLQSTINVSGFALQQQLEQEGVYPELADPFNVLFVFPLLKKSIDYPIEQIVEKITIAINKAATSTPKEQNYFITSFNELSCLAIDFDQMIGLKRELVSIEKSIGKIAAEMIIPYPPGIPLILEGEKITIEHIQQLQLFLQTGARFQGGSHLNDRQITVFAL